MLRRRSFKLALGALSIASALGFAACADDGVALHIECNVAPEVSDMGCTWDPSSMTCVFNGRMNLRAAQSYFAGFRVRSGLSARMTMSPPRAEPNGVQLQATEVELRRASGSKIKFTKKLPNPFTLVSTGYVAPMGTGILQVELVPSAYVAQLRELESDTATALGQVVASVRVRGTTDGQVKVETASFLWPIRLERLSPVESDGECLVATGICATLRGVDQFADVCLCPSATASPKDRSCDLGGL